MNRKILRIVLALVVNIAVVAVAPAFAKNLNLPPGAESISYQFGGDCGSVDLPTPLPPNYPLPATKIGFTFGHVKIPNAGIDSTGLILQFYWVPADPSMPPQWQPFAHLTTSAEDADFLKIWWSGTWVQLDASVYGMPPAYNTSNVILVSEDDLQVEKHGNRAYVSLNTPQEIDTWILVDDILVPGHFTLYPFSFELSKYGGSVHRTSTVLMEGFPGASGYTLVLEEMGFYANGVFNCPDLYENEVVVNDAFVAMHQTLTNYPPT